MLANAQRWNSGVGATTTGSDSGIETIDWRCRNSTSSLICSCAAGTSASGFGVLFLRVAPRLDRIAAVQAAGDAAELLLDLAQLAQRDRQQAVRAQRDAFLELQLLLELLATEPERGLGARREIGLEVLDVRLDGGGGLRRRVGEVAEDVQIVERRRTRAAGPPR